MSTWKARLGAIADPAGHVTFRVWAPAALGVDVTFVAREGDPPQTRALRPEAAGSFAATVGDLGAGARYTYTVDGDGPLPDPASRAQPLGVHGPSAVVDPWTFPWTDHGWNGRPLRDLVLYELHVGTFSPSGTFAGVTERLPDLRALGVTAVELMPVADFPGGRNWGYDGVALFAPARCYGSPDDLRRLVDTAHGLDLAVILDVVYNHLGPDGAYLSRFSPHYFTGRHASPWGAVFDLDGPHSAGVREFFCQNALHWVHEYHVDGLRLDATHAMHDDSPRHFLAELAATVRASAPGRHVHLIAEDDRNLARLVTPEGADGWGLDAVWADDFHHQMRRHLAGDADGYFRDFTGTAAAIAATLRQGWTYTGQHSTHVGRPRGSDPAGVSPKRFVFCLQNHDQVGNRAFGDRLHHAVGEAAIRAATTLLLTAPETPLLFMGQEWAASTPFCYFTDHGEPLGRLVTEGRRREFASFAAFSAPGTQVPDPQAVETFATSRLRWEERADEPHAAMLRFHAALLTFRREQLRDEGADVAVVAVDETTVAMRRPLADGRTAVVVARLGGAGDVTLAADVLGGTGRRWVCHLTSEDPAFAVAPSPPLIEGPAEAPSLRFAGPAAVILIAAASAAVVHSGPGA